MGNCPMQEKSRKSICVPPLLGKPAAARTARFARQEPTAPVFSHRAKTQVSDTAPLDAVAL
ncbi:hypothetical protein CNY67_02655 [Desulfovibrio sp. G11]|nr:hypothetical protein CNY67_02655 [Desulfovibrio sp. G11]